MAKKKKTKKTKEEKLDKKKKRSKKSKKDKDKKKSKKDKDKKKKTKKSKKGDALVLMKKRAVKDVVSELGFNSGADFVEYLNHEVVRLIKNAARRCDENGRATLKARDL